MDENGHITRLDIHYVGVNLSSSRTMKFDKTGKKLEEDSGEMLNKYKYDDRDFLIKSTSNYMNSQYVSEYKYLVDRQGNWIRKIQYAQGMPLQISEREIEYYSTKE